MAEGDLGYNRTQRARDARGRFTSTRNYQAVSINEEGANRGNQTYTVNRYQIEGDSNLELSESTYQHWLAQPAILRAVEERTLSWEREANAMAITKKAMYGSIIYNNRPELGPVGVVFCDNYPSVLDDMYHSTLHKVLARQGSIRDLEPLQRRDKSAWDDDAWEAANRAGPSARWDQFNE